MPQHKILFLDIESFPNIGYTWGRYDQTVIRFKQEFCIATFAAKWLGDKAIISKALPDYSGYKPGSYDDKKLVQDLWKLISEADVVVAHNGDDFDIRMCNARFLFHGLVPPAPIKTVDTKKIASRVARFNSNSLNDIGNYLNFGKKIKTDFDLWEGCINGDMEQWRLMVKYNRKDVLLLERLYLYLRPWDTRHPNLTVEGGGMCPKCNSKNIQYKGYQVTTTRKYRRMQCQDCGGWSRVTKSERGGTGTTNCG